MKKVVIFVFLVIFLVFGKSVFAQEIITGNASAKSEVRTEIQGNGNVQTHIKVEANGEKKELNASGPGTYKLEINSSSESSESATASLTPIIEKKSSMKKQNQPFIFEIRNVFRDFWQSLKKIFKI